MNRLNQTIAVTVIAVSMFSMAACGRTAQTTEKARTSSIQNLTTGGAVTVTPAAVQEEVEEEEEEKVENEKIAAKISEKEFLSSVNGELLLEYLGVQKKDVDVIFAARDVVGAKQSRYCEIRVKGREELNGNYFIFYGSGLEIEGVVDGGIPSVSIYKQLSGEEKKQLLTGKKKIEFTLPENAEELEFASPVYDGHPCYVGEKEFETPQIYKELASYKVKKTDTEAIWGAYGEDTYTDGNGVYTVSYVKRNDGDKWKKKIYRDGKWHEVFSLNLRRALGKKVLSARTFITGRDGTLWMRTGKNLYVYNGQLQQIARLDWGKWREEENVRKDVWPEITVVHDGTKAIFSFTDKNGKFHSKLVDVKTGGTLREYSSYVAGDVYGDYVIQYDAWKDTQDYVRIFNWRTGELVKKLNLENIRREAHDIKDIDIVYFRKEDPNTWDESMEDLINTWPYERPMHFAMRDGKLYISYCSGIYRYDMGSGKLAKIFDGASSKKFQRMAGTLGLAGEDRFYLLGGWDDDSATEFMELTKKK